MASGVNVKMGVSGVAQFKQGIKESQAAVKNLDQQLKLNEAQFKATGDAEIYMQNKSKMLEEQIEKQREVVKQSQAALEAMQKNGVDQSSVAFQKMQQQVYKAATDLMNMQSQLNNVAESGEDAGNGVDAMNQQLKHIGEGVDTKRVIDGINGITGKLEAAAKAAWNMGKAIVNATLGAGNWADDLATRAKYYGLTTTELQQMEKTAQLIDTPVDAILNAQKKLKSGLGKGDEGVYGAFVALLGEGYDVRSKDWADAFWDAGEALMRFTDAEEQEVYAQKLFGRSWNELIPLFEAGRKQYDEMNESWNVVSEDNIKKLTEMDDEYQKMTAEFETFKMTVLATMADVLTPVMETLTGLMEKFNEYLATPEGKEMLQSLGEAVSGLFSDLASVDPEQVVSGLTEVFGKITEGFQWLIDNRQAVIDALKFIVAGWAGLKLAGGALQILNLINGLGGLLGGGTVGAAGEAGTAVGSGLSNGAVAVGSSAGTTAGGLSKLMNNIALFGSAMGMYNATEGRLKQEWKQLEEEISGLSDKEAGYAILAHDLGMSVDEYKKSINAGQTGTSSGAYIPTIDPETKRWMEAAYEGVLTGALNPVYGRDEPELRATYNRMIELAEEGNKEQRIANQNAPTAEDIALFNRIPDMMEDAVIRGMSKVTIVIDDRGVGELGSRMGRSMWNNVVSLLH